MQDNIIDIITLIVATGGFAVSGFALNISIKNRRNTLRENIYNRELDALQELVSLMGEFPEITSNWITVCHFNRDKKTISDARNTYYLHILKIMYIKNRLSLFYPKPLDKKFSEFTTSMLALYYQNNYVKEEDMNVVTSACGKFQNDIRKYMKLEALSFENIDVIKDKKRDRD